MQIREACEDGRLFPTHSGTRRRVTVIPQPLQTYFFFGTCVRYLQDALPGEAVGDTSEGWMVRTNIKQFFKYLDDLNLSVSQRMPQTGTLRELYSELKKAKDS